LSHRFHRYGMLCRVALFIPFFTASLLYAGGNRKTSETDGIQFWHSVGTYNKEVLISIVGDYNKTEQQPPVQAVFQGSDSELYLKLLSQEKLPHLVLIPVQYLQALRENGVLADAAPFIPNRTREDIDLKYWDAVSIDEGIYGVPFSFDSTILYVNQHILRISGTRQHSEPDAWEEIIPILAKIRDNTDERWGLYIPMESLQHFTAFVESYTGKAVQEDRKLVVNAPETLDAMTTLQNFVYRDRFMPPKLTSTEAEQLFLSGNLGILMGSSSQLVFTQTNLPYDLTAWGMPSPGDTAPIISGSCLAITSAGISRGRDIFQFIEYLINHENAIKWHTHTGSPPIQNSTKGSLDLLIFYEENPNYMTPIIELERGLVFAPRFDIYRVDGVIRRALDRIMVGGEEPARILNDLQRELDMLLLTTM